MFTRLEEKRLAQWNIHLVPKMVESPRITARAWGCDWSNCNFPEWGLCLRKTRRNVKRLCFLSGRTKQINSAQQNGGIKSTCSNWSSRLPGTLSGKQTERRVNFHLIRELPTAIGCSTFFPSEEGQSGHPKVRREQCQPALERVEKCSVEEKRRRWTETVKWEGVWSWWSLTVSWKSDIHTDGHYITPTGLFKSNWIP